MVMKATIILTSNAFGVFRIRDNSESKRHKHEREQGELYAKQGCVRAIKL